MVSPNRTESFWDVSVAIRWGETGRWLDDIGQNYVEYQNGGVNYKIWIEDATSLEKKLTVMDTYGLAGGSFWKLGMEDSSIWDTIIKYIN